MYHRIMVPLDGSEHAESVISLACTLASRSNTEITLLCVVVYPPELYSSSVYCMFYPNPTGDPGLDDKIWQKKEAFYSKARDYLEGLASRIETSAHKVSIEIKEGPVAHAILSSIENLQIDLVIMSTTGDGCNPWMMGAIANRILREAQVPVIFVRKEPRNLVPDRSNLHSHSKKINRESI